MKGAKFQIVLCVCKKMARSKCFEKCGKRHGMEKISNPLYVQQRLASTHDTVFNWEDRIRLTVNTFGYQFYYAMRHPNLVVLIIPTCPVCMGTIKLAPTSG